MNIRKWHNKKEEKLHTYATGGGPIQTHYESNVHFILPEFSDKKIINWNCSVTDSKDIGYDMIIGRDMMIELKINLTFDKQKVIWEGIEIPMRDFNRLRRWNLSKYEVKAIIQEMKEPIVTKRATERMIKILDSKYEKADVKQVIDGAMHLNEREKSLLYKLLTNYLDVFDGTLGAWKTDPVDFEMVDGAKPHSKRYYPVPHLYKKTFKNREKDTKEKLFQNRERAR